MLLVNFQPSRELTKMLSSIQDAQIIIRVVSGLLSPLKNTKYTFGEF